MYSPESSVRKTGSYIYEEFMPTDGTDVKVMVDAEIEVTGSGAGGVKGHSLHLGQFRKLTGYTGFKTSPNL